MEFDEEKTRRNKPGQEEEDQGQGIPPVFFAQSGATSSAHSAAHGLSSNTAGFGTSGSGSVNSAAPGLSSGASDFVVPEFKPTNSAAQSLSGNASSLNTGVPEFQAEKPFRTTAKSGASSGVSRNTAEAARTAGKGSKATAKAARAAGKTTQAVGRAASTAAPVAGKVTAAAVQVKSVLASVMAVTLATAGVVSVAVNPKTYTEEQDLGTAIHERKEYIPAETAKTDEDILREMTPLPMEVPITPVPETPIPETPIPETPVPETPVPEPTAAAGENQDMPTNSIWMAEEGKYAEYGIPIDVYCDQEILKPGVPVTFKGDILGGTPPFDIRWSLIRSDSYEESIEKEFRTNDRHLEYTYTPTTDDEKLSMSLHVWDSRIHTSEKNVANDDWDIGVMLYTEEKWKEAYPEAGKPQDEPFPFIAKTNQANVNMRSWMSTDSTSLVSVLSDAGTPVYVYGKEYDESGKKWYKVRLNTLQHGMIRSDLLRSDGQGSALTDLQALVQDGFYSLRSVPVDIYCDHEVYRAKEPVTFSADILGGTPPFEVSWWIGESINRDTSPLDDYLEAYPDYPTSSEYTTNDRRVEFTYIPPVESEEFGIYLVVKDALGADTYGEYFDGGDWPADLWIDTATTWKQGNAKNAVPQEEQFPFMAVTNTENVNITWYESYIITTLKDKGTQVKVTGRSFDQSGTKYYRVRLALDKVGYIRADLLDKVQEATQPAETAAPDQPEPASETSPESGDITADMLMFAQDGYYEANDYFPIDVYADVPTIYALQPITFSVDILGGTAPFKVSWWVEENEYSYTTSSRHTEYVYTPSLEEEHLIYNVTVTDANGKEGIHDDDYGIDIVSPAGYGRNPDPGYEHYPFVAETTEDNVDVRWTVSDKKPVDTVPQKGTKVKVFDRSMALEDEAGEIWYKARINMNRIGFIRAEQLHKDIAETAKMPGGKGKERGISGEIVPYATDGYYYKATGDYMDDRRFIPVELWHDKAVYRAGDAVTLTGEVLGGIPPFDIVFSISEIGDETGLLTQYMESHPDYRMKETIHTDNRRVRHTFTLPVAGNRLAVEMTVYDSLGRNGESSRYYIETPDSWKQSYPGQEEPADEHLPFMARTIQDNTPVHSGDENKAIKSIPDKGTALEVVEKMWTDSGETLWGVRTGINRTVYILSKYLEMIQ